MKTRLAGALPLLLLTLGVLISAGAPRAGWTDMPVAGAAAPDTAHCVNAATLDLRRLLPPPPSAGSPQERSELDELLHIQAERTAGEVALARQDVARDIFRFAGALGGSRGLDGDHLPRTIALLRHLSTDETAVLAPAKRAFGRPRPYAVERRLAPVVERPPSDSYPSGHSLWAYTTALVLADMVPERRAQLLERADQYAHNRSVGGVHYPSDIEGGKLAGTALAAMLFACPAFEREEAGARAELRGALGLH